MQGGKGSDLGMGPRAIDQLFQGLQDKLTSEEGADAASEESDEEVKEHAQHSDAI